MNKPEGTNENESREENKKENGEENIDDEHSELDNICADKAINTDEYTCKKNTEYETLYNDSLLVNNFVNKPYVQRIKKFCLRLPGLYYVVMHMLFMILIGIIIFFVTNKAYLCMTLIVISLDAVANVVFFDCPLSSLEKKYLDWSMIESRLISLQKSGMMYANHRYYDTQLEVIINGWTLCAAKILCLIVFDWFHVKY